MYNCETNFPKIMFNPIYQITIKNKIKNIFISSTAHRFQYNSLLTPGGQAEKLYPNIFHIYCIHAPLNPQKTTPTSTDENPDSIKTPSPPVNSWQPEIRGVAILIKPNLSKKRRRRKGGGPNTMVGLTTCCMARGRRLIKSSSAYALLHLHLRLIEALSIGVETRGSRPLYRL